MSSFSERYTEWLADTADRYGLDSSTLRTWAKKGHIDAVKIGSKWKCNPKSVDEYIASLNPGR